MPKPIVMEQRYDFRGGRNTAISSDLLNPNELVDCTNARINVAYGGFTKRSGTQRIHQTAFPATVNGVTQWDGPSGKQVVVISNGSLYFRNGFTFSTAFTIKTPGTAFPNATAYFMPFRAVTTNAPLVLYIACGGHYYSWDGTATLTLLDGTNNAPTADLIIAYHTRAFAHEPSLQKTGWWSRIGDAAFWSTGTPSDGGSAILDFLSGEALIAMEVIGSSLLLATRDSVIRFTGQDSNNIVISQGTEGISSEVGSVSGQTLQRFENVAAMYSDRGPYVVTETYAQPIGEQLNPDWQTLDQANLANSSIEYNRNRKELLFALPGATDGGTPKTIFSQAVRLQAWQGPWIYPFNITTMGKYFDANNVQTVLAGSTDGFVRLMDVGNLDDVLYDGTGGSNITMTVEIPVMHFSLPGIKKALKWMIIQGIIPASSALNVKIAFDNGGLVSFPVTGVSNSEADYRVDVAGDTSQGFRCRVQFVDASSQNVTINGFSLFAWNMMRTT